MKVYDDSKYINPDTLHLFANTNEKFLEGEIKGIVVELPGLGGGSCLGGLMDFMDYDTYYTKDFAKCGIIVAYMFPGPWSWGNKAAIRYTDAVVRAIKAKYNLGEDTPLVVCGGSMGGVGALMYAADTTLRLTACAAACPCIDNIDCLDSNPAFPRTYLSAAFMYDMDATEALKAFSPIYRVEDMPDIPYFISNDGEDEVFPEAQCDAYVEKLREKGLNVEYKPQPGLKHGDFYPEVRLELHSFIKNQILN